MIQKVFTVFPPVGRPIRISISVDGLAEPPYSAKAADGRPGYCAVLDRNGFNLVSRPNEQGTLWLDWTARQIAQALNQEWSKARGP